MSLPNMYMYYASLNSRNEVGGPTCNFSMQNKLQKENKQQRGRGSTMVTPLPC